MIYLESFGTLKEIIFGTGHATFCLTNGTYTYVIFFYFQVNGSETLMVSWEFTLSVWTTDTI